MAVRGREIHEISTEGPALLREVMSSHAEQSLPEEG
jgi:hypothetical protein